MSIDHFTAIENALMATMASISNELPDQDREDVAMYIDHGEYGLAWDLLHFWFERHGHPLPPGMIDSGARMDIYPQDRTS